MPVERPPNYPEDLENCPVKPAEEVEGLEPKSPEMMPPFEASCQAELTPWKPEVMLSSVEERLSGLEVKGERPVQEAVKLNLNLVVWVGITLLVVAAVWLLCSLDLEECQVS